MSQYSPDSPEAIGALFSAEGDALARAGFSEPDLRDAPEDFGRGGDNLWIVEARKVESTEDLVSGEELVTVRAGLDYEDDQGQSVEPPESNVLGYYAVVRQVQQPKDENSAEI